MSESKKIFLRFVVFFFFSALIIASSVLIYTLGPNQYQYTNNSFEWEYSPESAEGTHFNVLLDTHSHTLYSDGVLTVEQNIKWHLANGFNAMVITDHNTWKHMPEVKEMAKKYEDEIIIFAGSEWTTGIIHLNILFPLDTTGYEDLVPPSNPTNQDIQDVIEDTHDLGGVVTINHFNWSIPRMPDHPTREQVYSWDADFIEIINEHTWDQASYDFVAGNEMGGVAGTDMHSPDSVSGYTAIYVDEITPENVWQQILDRNTTVLYEEEGSPNYATPEINPTWRTVQPLSMLGDMFENLMPGGNNLDWVGVSMIFVYLIGGFVIGEIFRYKINPAIKKAIQKKSRKNDSEE